ncbi:helix-turn-helix domain-containing protein [Pseudomonas carnis]|uniref:helix-turn-helix domain-containing protein n=1 Tax=Pseudomonas TaxID=286 RepID=UPI001126EECF|nr:MULTISPECIES: helix-turn-helix domain-containing protein [Pseudomonas]MBA1253569.1 helix-turn-helix domain-containing protein [Pseudomonas carnis]MBA1267639.1 helix-turn-helix domain-containing protein [Pseudomonas carnis]MCP9735161.1 helix-turn-helix domain-containing protein [Pseudomonas sp. GBPI_506]TPV60192.1 helix-turn-helix domain-containing protein [Pseudomonas fluorescens]
MTADTPRKFQGVWIPAERWLDRTLSPNEKVMLGEISSLETGPRGCYATNAHFAEFFDLSISRVSEIISGLVDKGHLRVELIREGKRVVERRLRLVDPFGFPNTPSGNAANPFGKDGEPPSENTQGNNTQSNNTKSIKNTPASGAKKVLLDEGFEQFWKLYPKKKARKEAIKAWAKLKANDELRQTLITALGSHCVSEDWAKENGRYIPNAATWINGERWTDELKPAYGATNHSSQSAVLSVPTHTQEMYPNDRF